MKLKTLDKATKLYEQIKALDNDILGLEKWGNQLSSGHFEIEVKFKFRDLDKVEKLKLDEDGSLVQEAYRPMNFMFYLGEPRPKEEKDTEKLEIKANESEALYMIGALLSVKYEKRKELVESIKKLGYE